MINIPNKFCVSPWINLYLDSDGQLKPCCLSNLNVGNFHESENIWNNEIIKEFRQKMLNNEHIPSCNVCYYMEDHNNGRQASLRQELNYKYINDVNNILTNRNIISDAPRDIDIRLSNICNLKCIMCCERFSHQFHKKVISLGDYDYVLNKLKDFLPTVEKITFAGGEPFLEKNHFKILEYLNNNKLFDIELHYYSNCSYIKNNKYNIQELWKNFKSIKFFGSIDGIGKRIEFLRRNSKWNIILDNLYYLNTLKNTMNNLSFQISGTFSAYNIHHSVDLFSFLLDNKILNNSYDCIFNGLIYPPDISISVLPTWYKQECLLRLENFIQKYNYQLNIDFIKNSLNIQKQQEDFNKFKEFTKKIDPNNILFECFPELKPVFEKEYN